MNIMIREERPDDYKRTEAVVKQAFDKMEFSNQDEHELVARLRTSEAFIPALSIVAVEEESNDIVGHILLTKITINDDKRKVESLTLAPVSVLPPYQNKGIGRLLIVEALRIAKELGYESVIVLGHPDYYPKFGFERASRWGIHAPFQVRDEVFMAIELRDQALADVTGVVEYPSAFFA